MTWILVALFVSGPSLQAQAVDQYDTMQECFAARESLVKQLGKPIVDYQAICVAKNNISK